MNPTYVVRSGPCAGRQALRRAPSHARTISTGPSFFPQAIFGARHHPFFGPPTSRSRNDVFDHFDDFVNRSFEGIFPQVLANARSDVKVWQPRFDVREVDEAYQLRGELPGVEAQDLEVEFSNENTLVVRGRTTSERSEGQPPAQAETTEQQGEAVAESANKAQEANDDTASVHSESSYVQPTVEDEADATRRESVDTETTADARRAATPNTEQSVAQQQTQQAQSQPQHGRYWVSERSTGSFSRTFEFPRRVDAEGVTASLKNGILDVVVPKAKAPEAKRIQVQ